MSGQTAYRALISGVSQAVECEVTTESDHGYLTGDHVRITDLGNMMPTARGMVQIDGGLFLAEVTGVTTFKIKDPVTLEPIDSTGYEPYVSGGRVNLENNKFEWST